jgi:hypothetical protein
MARPLLRAGEAEVIMQTVKKSLTISRNRGSLSGRSIVCGTDPEGRARSSIVTEFLIAHAKNPLQPRGFSFGIHHSESSELDEDSQPCCDGNVLRNLL